MSSDAQIKAVADEQVRWQREVVEQFGIRHFEHRINFHLLQHVPAIVRRFGPLNLYSNETLESKHKTFKDLAAKSNGRDVLRWVLEREQVTQILMQSFSTYQTQLLMPTNELVDTILSQIQQPQQTTTSHLC